MEGWLKSLIAIACGIVIVGGAYYGWNEYQETSIEREQARVIGDAENALYERAGAKKGESDKVRNVCESISRDPSKDNVAVQDFLNKCRHFGYL